MKNLSYIKLILLHVLIAVAVYGLKPLSKVYFIGIFLYFSIRILKSNRSEKILQILIACGYVVGVEVFLRMTGGNFLYETSKYLIILFCFMGIITMKLNTPIPYIAYVFLLIPGVLVAGFNIAEGTTIRTAIAFNLSGPACLGVVSILCYKQKILYQDIHKVLAYMALPVVTTAIYLFLYTPSIKESLGSTGSNFATSGGFGPNQVSTVLGIGMFVFSLRFFMLSPSLFFKIINGFILAAISYRAIITFSRGGVITALFMIIVFIYFYFKKVNARAKIRVSRSIFLFISIGLLIWLFSSIQTNGLIDKRYTNKDALGREKKDISTGRVDLVSFEIDEFLINPILGVGVGKIKELREQKEGIRLVSHNEISRILSEHGLFGMAAFLILLITPLFFRLRNKSNIFFYSFYFFWFLTINHSAMRIAAPAFIYGLCLLDIQYKSNKVKKVRTLKRKKRLILAS